MQEEVLKNAEVIVQTNAQRLKKNQIRRTTTTLLSAADKNGKGARLLIVEREYHPKPELQWNVEGRTCHLTLKSNSTHVLLQGYIRREDIANNASLGDQLCREMELMTDQMEEMSDLSAETGV